MRWRSVVSVAICLWVVRLSLELFGFSGLVWVFMVLTICFGCAVLPWWVAVIVVALVFRSLFAGSCLVGRFVVWFDGPCVLSAC